MPVRKKGKPGSIVLEKFDRVYSEDELKEISLDILERAKTTTISPNIGISILLFIGKNIIFILPAKHQNKKKLNQ